MLVFRILLAVEVSIHSTYAMRAYTDDSSEHESADRLLMAEGAPAQRCLPNGGLVSLVEVASQQSADANRAVWP